MIRGVLSPGEAQGRPDPRRRVCHGNQLRPREGGEFSMPLLKRVGIKTGVGSFAYLGRIERPLTHEQERRVVTGYLT